MTVADETSATIGHSIAIYQALDGRLVALALPAPEFPPSPSGDVEAYEKARDAWVSDEKEREARVDKMEEEFGGRIAWVRPGQTALGAIVTAKCDHCVVIQDANRYEAVSCFVDGGEHNPDITLYLGAAMPELE